MTQVLLILYRGRLRSELGLDIHSTKDFVLTMKGGSESINNNNFDEIEYETSSGPTNEQQKLLEVLNRQVS